MFPIKWEISPSHPTGETSADELAPWRELPVDFVVAGMPHCGTSSMYFGREKVEEMMVKSIGFHTKVPCCELD
jgi:hypothetical protein